MLKEDLCQLINDANWIIGNDNDNFSTKYEKVCSKNFSLSSDILRMCKYYRTKLDYAVRTDGSVKVFIVIIEQLILPRI